MSKKCIKELPLDLYYDPVKQEFPSEIGTDVVGELLVKYWRDVSPFKLDDCISLVLQKALKDKSLKVKNGRWELR